MKERGMAPSTCELLAALEPITHSAYRYREACVDSGLLSEFLEVPLYRQVDIRQRLSQFMEDRSLLPPSPSTLRGRAGRWFFQFQVRINWWIARAFEIRDDLLVDLATALISRDTRLHAHLSLLETRLAALEESRNGHVSGPVPS
jgi:hypothetical protein